jgi:RNA polymerase sigma-70 factor (ECF subfamily)
MMSRTTPADEVRAQLAALLPRLRRFARVIARNVADADDLVQVSVEKALVRPSSGGPGRNWTAGCSAS